jgi:hypothetical protein
MCNRKSVILSSVKSRENIPTDKPTPVKKNIQTINIRPATNQQDFTTNELPNNHKKPVQYYDSYKTFPNYLHSHLRSLPKKSNK